MSEPADIEAEQSISSNSTLETVKDITAGAAGGIAQVLIGQPFDIVKVRLQTQATGTVTEVASNIFFKEGPLAFYKGSLLPLLGIGACVSIQFGAFHAVRKSLEDRNSRKYGTTNSELSYDQYYLAGAAAGLANSVIATPVEHVRIRLQTQPDGSKRIYGGPQDCLKQIMRSNGFTGLFRGNVPCLFREFHGFGLWFVSYEALLKYDMTANSRTRKEVPLLSIALYGGIAGEILWFGTYPFDVIKSRMQTDGFGQEQKFRTMREAISDTWRQYGARGFFRGLGPTLARTMFTSGATFVTYITLDLLEGRHADPYYSAEQVKHFLN